jgi:hypothetical protein
MDHQIQVELSRQTYLARIGFDPSDMTQSKTEIKKQTKNTIGKD